MWRAELGVQRALLDLEDIAAVALPEDDPLPRQRLRGDALDKGSMWRARLDG
jgi:hypothetical protein